MVEHLGSGIPRILAYYPRSAYHFIANFTRVVLPFAEGFEQVTGQASAQAISKGDKLGDRLGDKLGDRLEDELKSLVEFCQTPRSVGEMMEFLNRASRDKFIATLLKPALEDKLLEMTIPEKPSSPNQRYIAVESENALK